MTDYANQAPPRREFQDASDAGTKGIGEALSDVTRDLSLLVQQELALAKAEVSQPPTEWAKPPECSPAQQLPRSCRGLLVARPLGGNQRPNWAWLGSGHRGRDLAGGRRGALLRRPRSNEEISGIPQTTETVRQVPNALKGQEERNL